MVVMVPWPLVMVLWLVTIGAQAEPQAQAQTQAQAQAHVQAQAQVQADVNGALAGGEVALANGYW